MNDVSVAPPGLKTKKEGGHACQPTPGSRTGATDQSCLRHWCRAKVAVGTGGLSAAPKISIAPLGRKRNKGERTLFSHPLSTGFASGRRAAAPLHPWLQSAAPLGRKRRTARRILDKELRITNADVMTATPSSPHRGRLICSLGREPVERYAKRPPPLLCRLSPIGAIERRFSRPAGAQNKKGRGSRVPAYPGLAHRGYITIVPTALAPGDGASWSPSGMTMPPAFAATFFGSWQLLRQFVKPSPSSIPDSTPGRPIEAARP